MKRPQYQRDKGNLCEECVNDTGSSCTWDIQFYPYMYSHCAKYNVKPKTEASIIALPVKYEKKEPESPETKVFSEKNPEKCIRYAYLP